MRVQLRETGSILVHARKDDVLDFLRRSVQPGASIMDDRIEGAGSTYIVREARSGTQVIHARQASASVPLATREREDLRRAVESDLFRLQRLFELK
jgi:hypothetical protein